jgi:hypothetical protein
VDLCDDDGFEVVVHDVVSRDAATEISLDDVQSLSDDDLLAPGVALAVVEGLVDDFQVDSGDAGTRVQMRWRPA